MKIARTILSISTILLLFTGHLYGQESKFKALFLYKFTEYIDWPSNPNKITIGVLGKTDIYDQLSTFAASKDNIEVKTISTVGEAKSCHIVFVPSSKTKEVSTYTSAIGKNSILIVSENSSVVSKGADIGFFLEQGKLRFLIDKNNIVGKKMTPSSKLLALGKEI